MLLRGLSHSFGWEGPGDQARLRNLLTQFSHQWVLPETGIDRLERLTAAVLLLFVGNDVLPTGECHGDGMGMIGKRMPEINPLPTRGME